MKLIALKCKKILLLHPRYPVGTKIKKEMIFPLRPVLNNSFAPDKIKLILNKKTKKFLKSGECIKKITFIDYFNS